jgi:DNA-binding transcriptional LysR family regulator
VEAKSFSAAADKLGMSKSLASRYVSALERSLSVKLLNRSTLKLSLTEAGAVFYEHCARIVQEAELAEQHLTRTQSEPAGLVRVTAAPAFAVRHVLPAFTELYQKYPKIRVNLSCSNRALDLGDVGFHLGIRVSFNPDRILWRES